jgi:dihydroxyacetone kinase DhaKLM complex PTS-EIIA-like component DhaM
VPPLTADRVIREDIMAAVPLVEDGSLLAAVEAAVGRLD